jgi:hypothetical protein
MNRGLGIMTVPLARTANDLILMKPAFQVRAECLEMQVTALPVCLLKSTVFLGKGDDHAV